MGAILMADQATVRLLLKPHASVMSMEGKEVVDFPILDCQTDVDYTRFYKEKGMSTSLYGL